MAAQSHILKYVHQHALQYLAESLGQSDSIAVPNSTKKALLSALFPLNQCTNIQLRDTKKSYRDGIEHSMLQTHSQGIHCEEHNDLLEESGNSSPLSFLLSDSLDHFESLSLTSYNSSTNSILLKESALSNQQSLLQTVNDVFMSLLKKKCNISSKESVDDTIAVAVTYGTNLFLQQFSSSSTHELCLDILAAKENGELSEYLHFTLEELFEKYEFLAFDRFCDAIVDTMSCKVDTLQTPEQPEYFNLFKDIWTFDPESFLYLSLSDVLSFYPARSSDSASSDDAIIQYEESAVHMNIVSCYHSLRREFLQTPPVTKFDIGKDLKQLEVLLVTGIGYHLRGASKEAIKPQRTKLKSLRFDL